MYYLSSSGLNCEVKNQAYDRWENHVKNESYINAKNYYESEAKNWQISEAWKAMMLQNGV